jgi:hypothetical protein
VSNQQIMQLVVIGLFVSASAISWIVRQIGEARQRRAMELELERRRREAARTGRDLSEIAPEVPIPIDPRSEEGARAEDLAQRRKRQLEELRRRQAQRAAQQAERGAGTPASASGTGTPTARGSTAARPQPASNDRMSNQDIAARREALRRQQEIARERAAGSRSPETPRPPKRTNRPTPTTRAPSGDRGPGGRGPMSTASASSPEQQRGEDEVHRLVPNDSESTAMSSDRGVNRSWGVAGGGVTGVTGIRRSGPVMLAGKPMTPAEWRRAFIVNEILGKPVAERDG